MGKTTIYLNKDAEKVYQEAKAYAGDNLSAVIVQGLKLYVEKMDRITKGMEEVVIFEGKHFNLDQMSQGKNLKFIGMLLAETTTQDVYGEGLNLRHRLYLTRKGKFLVHTLEIDQSGHMDVSGYKIFNTFAEVTAEGYPMQMLNEARKKIPEMTCEELDV